MKLKKVVSRMGISIFSLVLGMMLPVFTVSVYAGHAKSPLGYYTVYGINYSNYSYITTGVSNGKPYANSQTRAQMNPVTSKAPAGYMGSKARLFNGNDKLITETNFVYNSTETCCLNSTFASLHPAVSGEAYYGYGITAAYGENGYKTYYTFKSPKQNG